MATELPPYSANPPRAAPSIASSVASPPTSNEGLAGGIKTTSIADMKYDYFLVTRESANRYILSLTIDRTPLYRIELPLDPAAIGSILVLPAFASDNVPVAAARIAKNPKKFDAVASVCAREQDLGDAADSESWRPLFKSATVNHAKISYESYRSSLPIVTVPGLRASARAFLWRTTSSATHFELSSEALVVHEPGRSFEAITSNKAYEERDIRLVFAKVTMKSSGQYPEVIEMRRGGGLEFELAVVLQLFAILHDMKRLQ